MYAVKCYDEYGEQFEETDFFDTFDDACAFAKDMSSNFSVDIITPNGRVICFA